ncbi:MAG TPA: DUF2059 domain-containing protein [Xanthobacteraceae bacterium]|jgi:hypothetical protein
MTFASSIHRLVLAAAVAFACLGVTDAARAQQQPTPAALALAKEIVVLKGGAAMFDPLIPGVIERAKETFVPTNPQLIGDLNQVATQLAKEYGAKRTEVIDVVSKAYAQHFTEAELKEILAFYKSPAGRKMIAEEPKAIDQSLKAVQDWASQFSQVVLDRFRTEMKKKGHNL